MHSHNDRNFAAEVKTLEDETTRGSEQALASQEQRAAAAVHEITHSITSMSQENDLVKAEDTEGSDRNIIDPSNLGDKIVEFEKFIELLKLTHLEQETLDFFLRYTISSADLLRLKSTQDAKYLELEEKVQELEHGVSENHQREIDETKLMIFNGTEELAKDQDMVNELFLETTDVLEECEELMKELERAREEKKASQDQHENEQPPVDELYRKGDKVRQSYNSLKILEERMKQLESMKKEYDSNDKFHKSPFDPASTKTGCALNSLIRLWKSNFLPSHGWSNLELYPQTKRFQFDVSESHTIVIALDEGSKIKDVLVYIKDKSGVRIDENMQLELKQQHIGSAEIYKSMEDIIDRLIVLKTSGDHT
ncbi:Kre28p TDEL_0C06840 [Torulaspora delbrueckii]|uniref:Spindle pole body component KRE28 n=1 Tax=Torulaspora delbrueckii TaxID=4950 RepID=G8ZQT6_TORDE|nr:hypothetical protein TDEL_0C06840 [Torulaspora delbrueckii]CCE91573.1 hypothetical protein TDEL_0C06840 [Torulaspora delbrueckii]